jgi:Domain of unknown function (DUF6602)
VNKGDPSGGGPKAPLRELFLALQDDLRARLEGSRRAISHPTAKGDASELDWLRMLQQLPSRYQPAKAFVLDAEGELSDQIDVVIYDRQYSPLLFERAGTCYIPAESVYAVFEVRQELSAANIAYTGGKAASVRRLTRTSAPISWAAGTLAPRVPSDILAGILCLESSWRPALGEPMTESLAKLDGESRLDLGCALNAGAFEIRYQVDSGPLIDISPPETALIFFFLRLLQRLQETPTVTALDLREYGKAL